MTAKPDCVSDMLRGLQRDLNVVLSDQGHIHLDRARSAMLVMSVGQMADCARDLENAWSQAEWNRRALADRMELLANMHRVTAEVLGLMRPDAPIDSTVIPFRPRRKPAPGPSFPPDGNAA